MWLGGLPPWQSGFHCEKLEVLASSRLAGKLGLVKTIPLSAEFISHALLEMPTSPVGQAGRPSLHIYFSDKKTEAWAHGWVVGCDADPRLLTLTPGLLLNSRPWLFPCRQGIGAAYLLVGRSHPGGLFLGMFCGHCEEGPASLPQPSRGHV